MIGGFAGIIIAIIVVVIVLYLLNRPKPEAGKLMINEDNLEQIKNDLDTNVADGMFMTDMNIDWTFPDGVSASTDAKVGNSASNNYPINFDIILADTGEIIYTSDVIPVGYSIKEIILDKDLDPGEYSAYCKYHLLNEETGEERSSVSVTITLRVVG